MLARLPAPTCAGAPAAPAPAGEVAPMPPAPVVDPSAYAQPPSGSFKQCRLGR
ncbi:MAG: hypothetical protein U0894_09480 [Pirellulales bacterium]